MSTSGTIFGVQRFSTEDGPGIRTTVFVKGCPMRCPWCQNPEGIESKPILLWARAHCLHDAGCVETCSRKALGHEDGAAVIDRELCDACGDCAEFCPSGALTIAGRRVGADEITREILRDSTFHSRSGGGVTLSGGEPLTQLAFTLEVLVELGKAGVHRALDTCGAIGAGALEQALGHVELVLYDLKQMDARLHREQTGVPLDLVLENARRIAHAGLPVWIRTPIIPTYTDSDENVAAVARWIRAEMPRVTRYDLLAFSRLCVSKYEQLGRTDAPIRSLPLVPRTRMEHLARIARGEGVANVIWSGMTSDAKEEN